jgi:hypothetical protein
MQTYSQTYYALLYCQYDSASGSRRYDLLPNETITQLDLAVAYQAAQAQPLSEVTKIVYYGSPQAQQMAQPLERQQYALSIVNQVSFQIANKQSQ